MKSRLSLGLSGLLVLLGFSACSPQDGAGAARPLPSAPAQQPWNAPVAPSTRAGGVPGTDAAAAREAFAQPAKERPGLATGWGPRRKSELRDFPFERASTKPHGVDLIYYNDREGLKAMGARYRRASVMQQAAGGLVEWGIKGDSGFLPTFQDWHGVPGGPSGWRRYVEGRANGHYRIVVKNRCKSALQVVLSVDGLDVLDGRAASVSKRGYVIPAGETLEVAGFRTSREEVAAFRFSSVSDSYANRSGAGTRNVGVIGMAVYTQKGVDPWTWMPVEIERRREATPFAQAP
jgi:hypothetical protein